MNSNATSAAITARLIQDSNRLGALPRHFGRLHFMVETSVYDWLSRLSADYSGGCWHYYDLSNGGFYMAPQIDRSLRLSWSENYFEGTLSPDAAGIVACLYTFSHLSFRFEVIGDHFHALREFASEHAEASLIFAAID